MIEYKSVTSFYVDDLEHQVNALIAEGWIPQGGMSASLCDSAGIRYTLFAQAVTRKRPNVLMGDPFIFETIAKVPL